MLLTFTFWTAPLLPLARIREMRPVQDIRDSNSFAPLVTVQ